MREVPWWATGLHIYFTALRPQILHHKVQCKGVVAGPTTEGFKAEMTALAAHPGSSMDSRLDRTTRGARKARGPAMQNIMFTDINIRGPRLLNRGWTTGLWNSGVLETFTSSWCTPLGPVLKAGSSRQMVLFTDGWCYHKPDGPLAAAAAVVEQHPSDRGLSTITTSCTSSSSLPLLSHFYHGPINIKNLCYRAAHVLGYPARRHTYRLH
ncbi:uncharacterized protein LOC133510248 [Syngnathoides biaculeatus]|uniref:uncharacterized protein LOC133510248 n=1 Tax=Syngnathoides biaculeatus TaxID=300417 RepID=UPI002ADE176A|nr:uncharacterized protein LOC133510248 [Syngnathoides biaculeatus]